MAGKKDRKDKHMGTFTLIYTGSPNGKPITLTATASISDVDAVTFLAAATARFAQPVPVVGQANVFAALFSEVMVRWAGNATAYANAQATQSVTITSQGGTAS